MKKILLYTENYGPGGANRYLIDVVNSISANDGVYIFTNRKGLFNKDLKRIARPYNYTEVPVVTLYKAYSTIRKRNKLLPSIIYKLYGYLGFGMVFFLKKVNIYRLTKEIKKINPDVIISSNGGYPGGYTCSDIIYAANKLKIPAFLIMGSIPKDLNYKVFNFFYHRALEICEKIIVNTKAISDPFVNKWPELKNKFDTIINCIDLEEINNSNKNFGQIFRNEHDCMDYKTVGFVGRVEELKGVYVLLDAFAEVIRSDEKVKLILVGSGEIEYAKKYSEQLGIGEHVILTGLFEGNIYDLLNAFDIFVFPSLWEGLPFAILEAMASKKIIISTNVGGIPEVIENETTGILVNPNDSSQLATQLIRVLSNIDEFEQLAINAHEKVISSLCLPEFSRKFNVLLNSTFEKQSFRPLE